MPSKRTIIEIIVVVIFFIYATTTIEYETIPEPGVTDMGNGVLLYTLWGFMKKRILLRREDIFNILILVELNLLTVGSIWVEAEATEDQLFELKNSFRYRLL